MAKNTTLNSPINSYECLGGEEDYLVFIKTLPIPISIRV